MSCMQHAVLPATLFGSRLRIVGPRIRLLAELIDRLGCRACRGTAETLSSYLEADKGNLKLSQF
jgi:hypothetical protein